MLTGKVEILDDAVLAISSRVQLTLTESISGLGVIPDPGLLLEKNDNANAE